MKKEIITILIVLMMVQIVFAQDVCSNEYVTLTTTDDSATDPTIDDGTDFDTDDVSFGSLSPIAGSAVDFTTRTDNTCDAFSVYTNEDVNIDWAIVDSDVDSDRVVYNNGYVYAIGPDPNDASVLNIDVYTIDGTVATTLTADFTDDVAFYDVYRADYVTGGIVLAVIQPESEIVHAYHITENGQIWTKTYDPGSAFDLYSPHVYSNNNNFAITFGDTNGIGYYFRFDVGDGSLDVDASLTPPDNMYVESIYLDSTGYAYIPVTYYDFDDDEHYLRVIQIAEAEGYPAKGWERQMSTDAYVATIFPEMIECGSYLCFATDLANSFSIFRIELSDGTVQKEILYPVEMSIWGLDVKGYNLYAVGTDSTAFTFASSINWNTETINWNNNYDSDLEQVYDRIKAGDNTVALMGTSEYRLVPTLLSDLTGEVIDSVEINIEGNDFYADATFLDYYTGDLFVIGGRDYAVTSGYTGLYGITSDVDGPVPEFSLTTLLLATLLAGGLVLFVVRRKYK